MQTRKNIYNNIHLLSKAKPKLPSRRCRYSSWVLEIHRWKWKRKRRVVGGRFFLFGCSFKKQSDQLVLVLIAALCFFCMFFSCRYCLFVAAFVGLLALGRRRPGFCSSLLVPHTGHLPACGNAQAQLLLAGVIRPLGLR